MDLEPNVEYEAMIIKKEKRRKAIEKSRQSNDLNGKKKQKTKTRKNKQVSYYQMDNEGYDAYDIYEE